MRIFISGISGYIGNALAEALSAQHVLCGCDLQDCPSQIEVKHFAKHSILDLDTVYGARVVVHLAAVADDKSADADPARCFRVNVLGTQRLLRLAEAEKVQRFIFASSASIYARPQTLDLSCSPEDDPIIPTRTYALSKWVAERLVFKAEIPSKIILRQGTVYGLGRRMRLDNVVVHKMVSDALFRKQITVYGGSQWRPFIHIKDLVEAYRYFLRSGEGVINVATENAKISNLAQIIVKTFNVAVTILTPAQSPLSYRMDLTKFLSLFAPRFSLETGIQLLKQELSWRLAR